MCKRQFLLSVPLLLLAEQALASTAVGRLDKIWASPDSYLIMFSLEDLDSKLHRCNTSKRFSVNLSLPGGRATYELLQLAKQKDYVVSVETLNTCNSFDAENVKNISIK